MRLVTGDEFEPDCYKRVSYLLNIKMNNEVRKLAVHSFPDQSVLYRVMMFTLRFPYRPCPYFNNGAWPLLAFPADVVRSDGADCEEAQRASINHY
jgi:hypothetical protein